MKDKFITIIRSKIFFYFSLILASALIFCMIYGVHILNPKYVDWLLKGGDLSQHYLGWCSFRNSKWLFPLGMTKELSYPFTTSVIFTDSIPIFAVLFKFFRFFLPSNFQYFGFWGIFCFMLQAFFASKILELFLQNKIQIFFGALLFVLSPVIIWRMYAHTALAGHWILLFALYIFLRNDLSLKKRCILWTFIGILASSIHIYFVGMIGFIAAGAFLKTILLKKEIKTSLLPFFCYLIAVIFTVWILGGFSTKTASTEAGGLGYYSMNLNAFFNPQGWSYFLKDMAKGDGQYEGFAYLGAGIIFCLVYAVLQIFQNMQFRGFKSSLKSSWKIWLPFVLIFAAEFAFAASNVVTFNSKTIFTILLPKFIERFWSIFRASGRFSWVCVYLIIIFSLNGLSKINQKKFLAGILIFAFILQVVDLRNVLKDKHKNFNQIKQYSTVFHESNKWQAVFQNNNIKHIFLATDIPQNELYAIADLCLKNHKTLNRFYIAHGSNAIFDNYFENAVENPNDDSVYIFKISKPEDEFSASFYNLNYFKIDNYLVGFTQRQIFPDFEKYTPSQIFIYDFNGNYLNDGYDENGHRVLHKNGISYGPYLRLPAGKYLAEIEGKNLALSNISVYSDYGNNRSHQFDVEKTDKCVKINITLGEEVQNLEIFIQNLSDEELVMTSFKIAKTF